MADAGTPPAHRLADFTGAGYDKGRSVLWQAAWFVVQNVIFSSWWFPPVLRPPLLRAFGASVGDGVFIRHRVRVLWPWKLTLGDNCWIGEGAWLLNLEPITVRNDACVSQEAFLCTGSHDHMSETFEYNNAPIVIESSAWVAARAVVLRGVTIGQGSLVGANSVVTRSVPRGAAVPAGGRY